LLLFATATYAGGPPFTGDIRELDIRHFAAKTSRGRHLVAFLDPECSACIKFYREALVPNRDEIGERAYFVWVVRGNRNPLLLLRYGITRYPSVIKIAPNEPAVAFSGELNAESLLEFTEGEHEKEINRSAALSDGSLLWSLPGSFLSLVSAVHAFVASLDASENVKGVVGLTIGFLIPLSLLPLIAAGFYVNEKLVASRQKTDVMKRRGDLKKIT